MHFLATHKIQFFLFIGQKSQVSAGPFSENLKIRAISPIDDTSVLNFLSYKSAKFSNLGNRLPASKSCTGSTCTVAKTSGTDQAQALLRLFRKKAADSCRRIRLALHAKKSKFVFFH